METVQDILHMIISEGQNIRDFRGWSSDHEYFTRIKRPCLPLPAVVQAANTKILSTK